MDSIRERRSIRKFQKQPLDRNTTDKIVQAGILAPSAKNRQPWKFLIYSENSKNKLLDEMEKGLLRERDIHALLPDSKNGLADAFHTLKIMREAPTLIIVLNTNCVSPFETVDAEQRVTEICDSLSIGAAIENMLLRATELGIGSLWIANTFFAYPELVKYIGTAHQLVGAIALGVADEAPAARPRKQFDDIVEYR